MNNASLSRPKRICLWASPRNVSTALMYAFANRADTRVVDEPLYAWYLDQTQAQHPGRDTILARMDQDGERVIQTVMLGEVDRPVLFIKNMAHHLLNLDTGFLSQLDNVFLTREPAAMLSSYIKVLPNPSLEDTGYRRQWMLFNQLRKAGHDPVVLDAMELLLNPEKVLRQLCRRLEISFDARMLSWAAGPRPEDGVWAPWWYAQVHLSTGFAPYKPKAAIVPDDFKDLLAECRSYYQELYTFALKG